MRYILYAYILIHLIYEKQRFEETPSVTEFLVIID